MHFTRFTTARITLTMWYVLVLLFIIMAFSVALYTTETTNFIRVVLQHNFGNFIPRRLPSFAIQDLRAQVNALRKAFLIDITIIDSTILLIGGALSYFLAGKNLEPLQQSMEEQKEFLANASHEIRTPLAAIQTASEVALRGKIKTKDDYRKVIEQTYEESKRLSIMADELLTLSRFDAGMVQTKLQRIVLSETLSEVFDETRLLAQAKHIRLEKNIEPRISIVADRNKIKQLALILIDNAIKYTPSHSSVALILVSKPKIAFSIVDTGIGIAKKDQKKIFERFYQVDTARSNKSAGLGLSIAKWIADVHHAIITVKSGEGNGSTFTVTFS